MDFSQNPPENSVGEESRKALLPASLQIPESFDLTTASRQQLDEYFMGIALDMARKASISGEVPVGAVVVAGTRIISMAHTTRETENDPAGHAEFTAIRQAASLSGRWRLSDCTVYVSLEPCLMCAALMVNARINRCVYAASDAKAGALGTLYEVHADSKMNHNFSVTAGVRESESQELLQEFFKKLRLSEFDPTSKNNLSNC